MNPIVINNEPQISRSIRRYNISSARSEELMDEVVVEEPLEIRLNNKSITITMRTPGNDFDLAVGFLHAEGIIKTMDDVDNIRHCGLSGNLVTSNIVRVSLKSHVKVDSLRMDRHFYASSACGVCGKASLDALAIHAVPFAPEQLPLGPHLICKLPQRLRESQILFHRTGGLHGAALFDNHGEMLSSSEDVGRHNAVDKLIGYQLRNQKIMRPGLIMCISGRASFEILQKAIAAGVQHIIAVGAPSSLACELAERFNMTLVGFTGENRFNVYAGVC